MTDITTTESVTDKALRALMGSPLTEFTGEKMADAIDHPNVSSVQSALARGWESMTNGWEYIHRSEKRRPAFYWFDPQSRRVAAVEETREQTGNEICEVLGEEGGVLLIRRHDGRLYYGRRFNLSWLGDPKDTDER